MSDKDIKKAAGAPSSYCEHGAFVEFYMEAVR
jgi:hypothetical protein